MQKTILPLLLTLLFSGCNTPMQQSHIDTQKVLHNQQCSKLPQSGKCRGMFTKYYFDTKDKKCKKFYWGGCEGTIPFDTLNSCQRSCKQ